jgi:putative SOS response-associated peptidase YedK
LRPVPDELSIDSSHVKTHSGRFKKGESRKRLAVLAAEERANLADDRGRPVAFALTPGNVADIAMAAGTVDRPKRLLADDARELADLRWGLIPFWAKDGKGGARMINAQSETCGTKAAFREAFRSRSCLVIANGFYEWPEKNKPRLIKDNEPFAFPGVWETLATEWRREA